MSGWAHKSMIRRLDDAKKGVGMGDMLEKTTAADEPIKKKKKRKKKVQSGRQQRYRS